MTTPTKELIADLGLEKHPEGGHFKQTYCQEDHIPSPFAAGESRSLSTSIYYLLSYDNPTGVLHMNQSVTYHLHHQGRAEYTLITPGSPPKIEKHIIGPNSASGEKRQVIVGAGVWKMSQLLQEDLDGEVKKELVNCLITEVVVPGFEWADHQYLTKKGLARLFVGDTDNVGRYSRHLK